MAAIAHALYGYDDRTAREDAVEEHLTALLEAGRIKLLGCGHAYIPTFERHQRLRGGTTRVEPVKVLHGDCARTTPRNPAQDRGVVERNVVERNVVVAHARDDNPEGPSRAAPTSLKDILPDIATLLGNQ